MLQYHLLNTMMFLESNSKIFKEVDKPTIDVEGIENTVTVYDKFVEFLSSSRTLLYILIFLLTVFVMYVILKKFGTLEGTADVSKTSEKISKDKSSGKKREHAKMKLEIYSTLCNYFRGIVLTDAKYNEYKYLIGRLNEKDKTLDRLLTPEEFAGKLLVFLFLGAFCIPLGFATTKIFWIPAVILIAFALWLPKTMRATITDEDEIIDIYFIDLYLLLYSKLRQGSKARLSTTVESYIDTLQGATNIKMKNTMTGLAQFFLNNLTMYPDHEAVPKLRERYKSATIVNFCNVATQALQGIDNADTLLTFKMALTEKKTRAMKRKARKMCEWAERSIYAIYLILLVFIILTWLSKIL